MEVELYIGTAGSNGTSGKWFTIHMTAPDELRTSEEALNEYLTKWMENRGGEYVFWGIYNIEEQLCGD